MDFYFRIKKSDYVIDYVMDIHKCINIFHSIGNAFIKYGFMIIS